MFGSPGVLLCSAPLQVLLFVQADVAACVARNAERPPARRVPESVLQHMAEVFEWPDSRASPPWERAAAVVLQPPDGAPGLSLFTPLGFYFR